MNSHIIGRRVSLITTNNMDIRTLFSYPLLPPFNSPLNSLERWDIAKFSFANTTPFSHSLSGIFTVRTEGWSPLNLILCPDGLNLEN